MSVIRAIETLKVDTVQRARAWLIEAYREPLEARFADEVVVLYEKIVETILAHASGRSHYRQAIAYLRRMKKIGQAAWAEAIADRIKKQYANRQPPCAARRIEPIMRSPKIGKPPMAMRCKR